MRINRGIHPFLQAAKKGQNKKERKRGVWVLTIFSASDVGQDPEAFRLQVGSTASPLAHVLVRFYWPDHCLVHRRCAVYHRLLDGQSSTGGQRVHSDLRICGIYYKYEQNM